MKPSLNTYRAVHRSAVGFVALGLLTATARADAPDAGTGGAPSGVEPPPITVLRSEPGLARGLIFVAPISTSSLAIPGGSADAGAPPSTGQVGPEIVDDQGRAVWFSPITNGQSAADFRVQRYHGEPVLTWSQSKGFGSLAQGLTTDYILDRKYKIVATVTAGNGLDADSHEFKITREGTALITIYNAVTRDLSSLGGSTSGLVIDGVVQEIDIASGKVLFEWHSLDHVPLEESHQPLPASATTPYDYFHINAVSPDEDGNLLISSRHTWTVYKLDRHSGAVIWRLGGKNSDFSLGPGVAFAYQHNPIAVDRDTIRIFDNESNGTPVLPESRVIWVRRDDETKTATLVRSFEHPDHLSAGSQGGSQALSNGDTFVGWGAVPRISEFDREGNLVFDASLPAGYDTYRAYRFEWVGEPETNPTATGQVAGATTSVHAIWNGATEVARWEVLEGNRDDKDADDGHAVASAPWNGLDTTIVVHEPLHFVRVVAKDRFGREIGRSAVTPVTQ
jgi:arylsulfotransferase ASST